MPHKKQSDTPKTYTNKHLVIPVFFNEPTDLTGWCESVPAGARIVAVKSVLYSDGSAKRFYKVESKEKKKQGRRKKCQPS